METTLQKKETNGVWVFKIFDFRNLLGYSHFNILANGNLDIWLKNLSVQENLEMPRGNRQKVIKQGGCK